MCQKKIDFDFQKIEMLFRRERYSINMPTAREQQLAKQLDWAKRQKSYAWAKYFESEASRQRDDIGQYEQIERIVEVDDIPLNIRSEFKDMLKALKKKIECPICYGVIEPDDMKLTNCGHKYCPVCFEQIDKCAICRKPLKKK